jgi:hypothetical protein
MHSSSQNVPLAHMAGVGLTYCIIIVRTINWLEFKWGFFFQPVRRTQVQGSNSSHHNDIFFSFISAGW